MEITRKTWLIAAAAALLAGGAHGAANASPWVQVGTDVFGVAAGVYRTQGMTSDGTDYYFSWQYGLEKTDTSYNVLANNSSYSPFQSGIPPSLSALGYNHIGDIDYANGIIYASLDSSTTGYNMPAVALYNASDLSYTGTYYTLNPPDGTHDIASWFAVDAATGLAYGMAYDNATEMAVYNLSDWSFVKYIPLSESLDQVQGGKVFGDYMYMWSNASGADVYRMDLLTGDVEMLFSVKQPYDQEVEGLSVTPDAAGDPELNVLVVNDPDDSGQNPADPNLNLTIYHYEEVPEPRSVVMLFAGMVGLAATRMRMRRH